MSTKFYFLISVQLSVIIACGIPVIPPGTPVYTGVLVCGIPVIPPGIPVHTGSVSEWYPCYTTWYSCSYQYLHSDAPFTVQRCLESVFVCLSTCLLHEKRGIMGAEIYQCTLGTHLESGTLGIVTSA